MASTELKATMTIPKNGKKLWTDMMQNPPKPPQGVTEGQYLAASYAKFSDGTFVFGGVAVGPTDQDFNYALFMVFDKDYNQIGGWPIDTSDWEDFQVSSIEFAVNDQENPMYLLEIVEEK